MKRINLMLSALFVAAVSATCLTSCGFAEGGGTEKDEYGPLNEMLKKTYSQVTLTVTNSLGNDLSLVSEYVIEYSDSDITINYSVERFASITLDNAPDEFKTTLTGTAIIKDGDVVIVNGSALTISADIAERGMNFKKEYFTNTELSGMYLKADVIDAIGFMGTEMACTDMKVYATFLEMFYDIKITYNTKSGNAVELLYEFTL